MEYTEELGCQQDRIFVCRDFRTHINRKQTFQAFSKLLKRGDGLDGVDISPKAIGQLE